MGRAFRVSLGVVVHEPQFLAEVVELLSRAQAGLALEDYESQLNVDPIECDCEDDGEDDTTEDEYTPSS